MAKFPRPWDILIWLCLMFVVPGARGDDTSGLNACQIPRSRELTKVAVTDFGRSSLPKRTSRLAATCVHVKHSIGSIDRRTLHTRFACRQKASTFRTLPAAWSVL